MTESGTSVTVEFDPNEYERLLSVTDDPTELVREAVSHRLDVKEAVAFTRDGGFRGPDGFARMRDDDYPAWPLGGLLGIELRSMGDGEARFVMEVGPEHANPMGTVHGGVLCDIGDAALSTAYMSTVGADESFTTVGLTANFLRPFWTGRLEAVGRVVHRGRTVGLAECEVTNEGGKPIARLSGTCMTLREESADRIGPREG